MQIDFSCRIINKNISTFQQERNSPFYHVDQHFHDFERYLSMRNLHHRDVYSVRMIRIFSSPNLDIVYHWLNDTCNTTIRLILDVEDYVYHWPNENNNNNNNNKSE